MIRFLYALDRIGCADVTDIHRVHVHSIIIIVLPNKRTVQDFFLNGLQLGAPTMLSYNHPDRLRITFDVPHGGKLLRSASNCSNPQCELVASR